MRLRSRKAGDDRVFDRAEAALSELVDGGGHTSGESARIYEDALGALRRTRAILEGVGDGVYVTDRSGKIRMWNRAAERLIGTPEKRAIGRSCDRVLGFSKKDQTLDCSNGCALLREIGHRPVGASVEVTRFRPGARLQDLLVSVCAVEGLEGGVSEVVHSMRDITALKQADEAKTMFLATASHELKTPLTVILGFTQTLVAGWLDEGERDQALRSIEIRTKQLSRIVDRLLLTGRIEAGRVKLELSAVPIADLLRERAESFGAATGRRVVCHIDGLSPAIADEQALTTVIDHLLDNAAKYSPDGGDVVLSANDEGSTVVVEVTDQGVGMNADEAARCFDRFWQAEQSDVRRFGGTGVGLYIVKSMVEGMNGSVGVRSAIGEGSTFTIALRRADEDAAPGTLGVESADAPHTTIQRFMRQLGVPKTGEGACEERGRG